MIKLTLVVAAFAVAACGDDDGGTKRPDAAAPADAPRSDAAVDAPRTNACGSPGVVNGMVMGQSIAPVMRAQQLTLQGGVVIVLDEVAGACGMNSTTGEHLVLIFCAAPTTGAYPVVGEQAFSCPSSNSFGLVERDGGMDFAESTGGSITISNVTATCVHGTFTIDYPNSEQLTGSFDAEICP